MGVFGAVFGRRGDAGFSGPLLGVSSGVVGFNVATLSRLVREKVRPAWSDGGREREKVRPARLKQPKIGVFALAGRTFSRKSHWRGCAGRVLSRQAALRPGLVGDVAHEAGCRWGFCSIRSWLAACRRRVVPLMTPFPPFRGGPAAPSAASARAPSRRTSPWRARRRSLTTTSIRRRRNMSAALDRLKQQNELE